jgi:hypothetical protein
VKPAYGRGAARGRLKRAPLAVPLPRSTGDNEGGLSPLTREIERSERTGLDLAVQRIAGHGSRELQRHRERAGDGIGPGDVVAIHLAVLDVGGIALSRLAAGERSAAGRKGEGAVLLTHRPTCVFSFDWKRHLTRPSQPRQA